MEYSQVHFQKKCGLCKEHFNCYSSFKIYCDECIRRYKLNRIQKNGRNSKQEIQEGD